MPIMEWDQSLDIGVEAMNHEHRDILAAMNAIYDAHRAGKTGPEINLKVSRLGDICVRHFSDEERYMSRIGYPGLANHQALHAKLLKDFAAHAEEIRNAGGTANDKFFHFLRFWLGSHIRGIDAKYGEHARAASAA